MPSVSAKQHRLMAAVATNPAVAKKTKIPQSVGKEFMEADKGKKFNGGGMANTPRMNRLEELGRVNAEKAYTAKGKKNLAAEKKRVVGELKMAKGGESKAMVKKEVGFMKAKGAPKSMIKHEMAEAGMKRGGGVKKMASGGLAAGHKSADGIVSKGRTKAKQVTMKKGGYC